MPREAELADLVLGEPWLRQRLEIVATLALPDCWIGAGAVRDLVWDTRFGDGFDPRNIADVDVVYFDAADRRADPEHAIEARLSTIDATVEWDVKNQARVHLWYEARFGVAVEPLTSTVDGVATWPETATAIAVRLNPGGVLEIAAPFGLDDLLDGVWRRNPARVTDAEYQARIERKRPHQRWPGVVVVP